MRTKITLSIGHLENELSQDELRVWLRDQLSNMLSTNGGMTSFTLDMEEQDDPELNVALEKHLAEKRASMQRISPTDSLKIANNIARKLKRD